MSYLLSELQEKKKKAEGGGGEGKGEKGKGKEDDDGEDALDWWSRYYETLKDRERNERSEEQKSSRPSKKKDKREEESEEEKLKKKIPRLTVRKKGLGQFFERRSEPIKGQRKKRTNCNKARENAYDLAAVGSVLNLICLESG